MAIAILFVYLIMVALYDSFLYPFIVLFSLPVALIGALLALALARENLSIFSIIGMIMLMGLVAKNAILLVDFTNHLRERGMSVRDALIEAGRERLRPILMTTLAMVFGMLPIALATGAGAETKKGLAWVIIGGLTSSLLLTLVLVPSAYMTFENIIAKVRTVINPVFGRQVKISLGIQVVKVVRHHPAGQQRQLVHVGAPPGDHEGTALLAHQGRARPGDPAPRLPRRAGGEGRGRGAPAEGRVPPSGRRRQT